MTDGSKVNRRQFVRTAVGAGVALSAAVADFPAKAHVLGANDRINVAFIGVGGRGTSLLREARKLQESTNSIQILSVCDVYAKRKNAAQELTKAHGYLDYRELLNRNDIDAVFIATPDHWHAKLAIEAMDRGKDVYLEKPMTHTIEEAKDVHEMVMKTKRVLQVGSQTTSSDQWWKARKAIQDGMIGKLLMSQGSYHRNSLTGEWNRKIDVEAGPSASGDNYLDWKMWLGPAPSRPFNADRFFRFRKYWDYSGGIATDLFYHVMAPLNICWGEPQFPYRVSANGGIYVFKDEREVPDTFTLTADFAAGHTLCLSACLGNNTHIPGLVRGHEGTIVMVPGGQFESKADFITVTPQSIFKDGWVKKWGADEIKIMTDKRPSHMENFFTCMRTREKPVLDSLTAYKAQVTISLAVQAYREGRVLFFDEQKQKVVTTPPRIPTLT